MIEPRTQIYSTYYRWGNILFDHCTYISIEGRKIGEALIENVVTKSCVPDGIIMDQDSTFMSSLMNYLFNKFDIKIKTVAPFNDQSLQAEHGIKSLSMIFTKHLTNLGQM